MSIVDTSSIILVNQSALLSLHVAAEYYLPEANFDINDVYVTTISHAIVQQLIIQ